MRSVLLLLLATGLVISDGQAQSDTTFKPSGKLLVQVINRMFYVSNGNSGKYGMYINRAHFGYRYQFDAKWSGTVIVDLG